MAELDRQIAVLARALRVVDLMNVQYAVKDGATYIIKDNPRVSRTIPFVAKATGVPIAKIAARVIAREMLADLAPAARPSPPHVAVKEVVLTFIRFPGVDAILGLEMKSTGEVLGIDTDFWLAFAKSQLGAGTHLPRAGTAFILVKDRDKPAAFPLARRLMELGFHLVATDRTCRHLRDQEHEVRRINKVPEGRPHCVEAIISGDFDLVVNTTEGVRSVADSFSIRRSAFHPRRSLLHHHDRRLGRRRRHRGAGERKA